MMSQPGPSGESWWRNELHAKDEVSDEVFITDMAERLEILEQYDSGPGKDVDAWEDPQFEVYQRSDRYGFMRDPDSFAGTEQKQIRKENEREVKWLKMRGDWDRFWNTPKFRRRVYKGIPDKLRGDIWARLLRIDQIKSQSVYPELRARARYTSSHVKQIDLDVNRTYRTHVEFRHRYSPRQEALFHVLTAYSAFNSELGYCQGMSQIAALLLMYFDEEDAFWALHVLMVDDRHGMHGLFAIGFPKLLRLQAHFDRSLQASLPRLYKRLAKLDITSALYTTKWFLQCFLDRVPFNLALRLWDMYMMDGDRVLIAMAYNILHLHRRQILKGSFESVMELLQITLEKDFGFTDDEAIKGVTESISKLSSAKLLPVPDPGASSGERPTTKFGEVLRQRLANIERAVEEVKRRHKAILQRKAHEAELEAQRAREEEERRNMEEEQVQAGRQEPQAWINGPVQLSPIEEDASVLPKGHYATVRYPAGGGANSPTRTVTVIAARNGDSQPYETIDDYRVAGIGHYSRISPRIDDDRPPPPPPAPRSDPVYAEVQKRNGHQQRDMHSVRSFYDNIDISDSPEGDETRVLEKFESYTSPDKRRYTSEYSRVTRETNVTRITFGDDHSVSPTPPMLPRFPQVGSPGSAEETIERL